MAGMFSIQKDGKLVELQEKPYDNEDIFQGLLASYPSLIPGDQIDNLNPVKLLLITREAGISDSENAVSRWNIDHLFVDQNAIPTLVEVKRSSDTRIRREVVGQVIEYAANAVAYWSVERLEAVFESNCRKEGKIPEDELRNLVGVDAISTEEFWKKVETNLKAGNIRLLFVADVISNELRRMVEFLNEQMNNVEVLAVEIKQYIGQNIHTLVPRVLGQIALKENKKATAHAGRDWDEASFFTALENSVPETTPIARKIYEWSKRNRLPMRWGKGNTYGAFYPTTGLSSRNDMFGVLSNGKIELSLYTFAAPYDTPEKRQELLSRINAVDKAIAINEQRDYPRFEMSVLRDDNKLTAFLDIFDAYIKMTKSV